MEEGKLIHARWIRFTGVTCFVFFGALTVLSQFIAR